MNETNSNYSILRYLNVRSAYFPSFSSDGQQVAFLSDIIGVPQVWRVELDDSSPEGKALWPEQTTFESDRVMGVWYSPAPSDGRLIYARDVGGNENAQLFLLSADGAIETPLTAGYDGAMHIFGEWSHDGKQILFVANRRHPALFDLYLQPLDGEAIMVWQNEQPGYLFSTSFSPDEQRAVTTRAYSSFSNELVEVDLSARTARTLSPPDVQARYASPRYMPDGKSVLVLTDLNSDFLYVGRLDLQTGAVEAVVAPEWDVELMELSPDGRYLAYDVNVDGVSELSLRDLVTGDSRKVEGLGGVPGATSFMDAHLHFSTDSSRLAFSYMSATRTSDIYVWDLTSDRARAVTRSSHGGLPRDSFASPELVRYPTFDGRQIPAWLYRPMEGDGPVPAIVVVHGGPEAQYRPYFHFLAQYFVHHGYAVLAPNVRGSTGYGKAYSHLDDVTKRMDLVADLAHAAQWLKEQPGIEGDRLVVYGGSYGGFMVLSALTTYPDLWAAGVDIVGISNFVTFLENTSEYRRAHREAEYGSLERDRQFLEEISPFNYSDKIAAPLLIIHGANDPRVPLGEAQQLAGALEARGVPVDLLVFDDEGHGVVKLKNKLVAYPAIVDFLNKHLARQ